MGRGGGSVELLVLGASYTRKILTFRSNFSNIAEQLVLNGLATVIKHRERDDRSSHYDALLAAESKALESKKGLYSKETPPKHRVTDCTGVSISLLV